MSSAPPKREFLGVERGQVLPPRGRETPTSAKSRAGSAEERAARKTLARVEKRLAQLAARETELNDEFLAHASDHERLTDLGAQLAALAQEREGLEVEWLEAAEDLE